MQEDLSRCVSLGIVLVFLSFCFLLIVGTSAIINLCKFIEIIGIFIGTASIGFILFVRAVAARLVLTTVIRTVGFSRGIRRIKTFHKIAIIE